VVLAPDAPTTSLILDAVGDRYARAGSTVVEAGFDAVSGVAGAPGMAVVAAELGMVECLLDDDDDPAELGEGIGRLVADGWTVTVLVPAYRIGAAHAALRRRPARIQPWWVEGGEHVRFGALEVP